MRARAAAHSRTWATEPGRTGQFGVVQGLDAVDDRHRRPQGLQLLQHQLQVGFREQQKVGIARGLNPLASGSGSSSMRQPTPAQLHLLRRLLGAHVSTEARPSHGAGALEQQRALADAGIAAQQHERGRAPAHRPAPGRIRRSHWPAAAAAAHPPPAIGSERRGWGGGAPAAAAAAGTGLRRRLSGPAAPACSTSVFQLPQLLQRPKNWRVWAPQLVQT